MTCFSNNIPLRHLQSPALSRDTVLRLSASGINTHTHSDNPRALPMLLFCISEVMFVVLLTYITGATPDRSASLAPAHARDCLECLLFSAGVLCLLLLLFAATVVVECTETSLLFDTHQRCQRFVCDTPFAFEELL